MLTLGLCFFVKDTNLMFEALLLLFRKFIALKNRR